MCSFVFISKQQNIRQQKNPFKLFISCVRLSFHLFYFQLNTICSNFFSVLILCQINRFLTNCNTVIARVCSKTHIYISSNCLLLFRTKYLFHVFFFICYSQTRLLSERHMTGAVMTLVDSSIDVDKKCKI